MIMGDLAPLSILSMVQMVIQAVVIKSILPFQEERRMRRMCSLFKDISCKLHVTFL